MEPKCVFAVYFSPAGSTKAVTERIAGTLAEAFKSERKTIDFTLPGAREQKYVFGPQDLVVFGTPTYAGRVPNKALPFVQTLFSGSRTPAVAVVTFGNRSYDSSLSELRNELLNDGLVPLAAAAFSCRHVFSEKIAAGRPDAEDLKEMDSFAQRAAKKIEAVDQSSTTEPVSVKNDAPVEPYYVPKKEDGTPAKFLKAIPKVDLSKCDHCLECVRVCPMGTIDPTDIEKMTGPCIKCQACILKCHTRARYFDNPDFLSHVAMLEKNFTRRASNDFFL